MIEGPLLKETSDALARMESQRGSSKPPIDVCSSVKKIHSQLTSDDLELFISPLPTLDYLMFQITSPLRRLRHWIGRE